MDLSNPVSEERIRQLEATATESKEMSDYYMAEMIAREEDVRNLENELEMKEDLLSAKSERVRQLNKELNDKAVEVVTAVCNAQHFIHKVSARDGEIRELKTKLNETETEMEDLRSDLQHQIDEVNSRKEDIQRLEKQLWEKEAEVKATCSKQSRAIVNECNNRIRQLRVELKKKDEVLKMKNDVFHGISLALRLLFSILEVLLLSLWIFDYGSEEEARRTVLNMLTGVVFAFGLLLLDSNPVRQTLTASWAFMNISLTAVSNFATTTK